MDLDLGSTADDELLEIPHAFETDLHCVVVANYALTLEAIDRSEEEELTKIDEGFANENSETVRSIAGQLQNFYEDLRQAARRLALVGFVTRLQHWIGGFAKQMKATPCKTKQTGYNSTLANQIAALNKLLGIGPVPEIFFEDLATARDSIIHADSRAEWEYNGSLRKVADHYRNAYGDVDLSEEKLEDAIQKATQQVKWYDERIPGAATPIGA
jgi:hypothetical protein